MRPLLGELLRSTLRAEAAPASTIRNQVYRFGKLIKVARAQGLIPSAKKTFDAEFPIPPRPGENGPPRRRWQAILAFAEWCAAQGISFPDVNVATFRAYRAALRSSNRRHSLARSEVLYSDLRAAWREQADKGSFPSLELPRWKDESISQYGLSRHLWPIGIEADFARLERGGRNLPLRGEKRWLSPLRAVSLDVYQGDLELLLGYATNVVEMDISPADLGQVLANEGIVFGFIQWHRDVRCKGTERAYHNAWLSRYAGMLEWFGGSPATADCYRQAACALQPRRVRDPFPERPLEYSELVEASVLATTAAVNQWNALSSDVGPGPRKEAACALRDAVCLALLICRPMRSDTIRSMRLGENLIRTASGTWRLQFEEHEMKTRSYTCEFPHQVIAALELYLEEARLLLATRRNSAIVFPTKSGGTLTGQDLWRRMTQIGMRYLSVKTNPHLFRYLVPCAYLLGYPDRLEAVS